MCGDEWEEVEEEEEEEEVRTDVADMEAESQQVRMLQLRGTYVRTYMVLCSMFFSAHYL